MIGETSILLKSIGATPRPNTISNVMWERFAFDKSKKSVEKDINQSEFEKQTPCIKLWFYQNGKVKFVKTNFVNFLQEKSRRLGQRQKYA